MNNIAEAKVEIGFKQTEVGLIPEDWEVKPLSEAVEFLDGKRRPIKSNERVSGEFPYYGASGIIDYVNDYIFNDKLILLGEDGENILSRSLPLAFIVKGKVWVNNHAHVMKPNNDFDIYFLTEFLESLNYSLLNSGTAQPKLNKRSCLQINVPKPPLTEQKTIATALSDVDELINSLEQLIAKKKVVKQGTMQELLGFDSAQPTTPRKRLPGFSGDWTFEPIKEISTITTGGGDTQDKVEDGEFPFYVRSNTVERINKFTFDGEAILTSGDGVGVGKIFHYVNEKFDFHQRVYCIYNFRDNVDGKYLFWQFSTRFYERVMSMTAKSSVDSVRREMIADMKINLPPTKEEQEAISKVLSDMDLEIDSLETKKEKYKRIKEGMMQELLTGKTRLV